MRSSLPSPSESKLDSTHTSPLIQSAVLAEKTFWARPLTNVGTAGAGSGAGALIAPGAAATLLGGNGLACALPTIAAMAIVAVSAPACAKRLENSMRPLSSDPLLPGWQSVRDAPSPQPSVDVSRAEISPHPYEADDCEAFGLDIAG